MLDNAKANVPLLVIVGPTAVGKTRFSLEIAKRFRAEIISGDSMQVYRGMDIGTAKASPEERALVPHHLIDIRDPDEAYSVSDFQQAARSLIADIAGRDKLPMIVGGTGLYIEAACFDFQFSDAPGDEAYREEQKRFAARNGVEALHDKLRAVDEVTAKRLHPNDVRRVIRALEIFHLTGKPLSQHLDGQTKSLVYDACFICLTMQRDILYARIDERVDQMLEAGLVEEVRSLLASGYTKQLVSMQGLGYKEIISYLHGECELEEAVALLKRSTRRFAKRQLSWFRRMEHLHWIDVTEQNFDAHLQTIHDIIAGKFRVYGEYSC